MHRGRFIQLLAAFGAAGSLPLSVLSAPAAPRVRVVIPAGPGSDWDRTGRALGSAMQAAGVAGVLSYDNWPGAAGVPGLVQFINATKGDPNAMLVVGAAMLGGIIMRRPPVNLSQITAIARIATQAQAFVLPVGSRFKTMADVLAQFRRDAGSVTWAGGPRGSTGHIAVAMMGRAAGVDPARLKYLAFARPGDIPDAILAGTATVGVGSYGELAGAIRAGRIKAVGVSSGTRLPGIDLPTLREQNIDVEIGDWRGVYGAIGITFEQRAALILRVQAALETSSWRQTLQANGWAPALLTGARFDRFVDQEFSSLRATMAWAGIV